MQETHNEILVRDEDYVNPFIAHFAIKDNMTQDEINSPAHYTNGSIECIEAIKASLTKEQYIGYLKGNVMKYNWRLGLKGKAVVDAQKAAWYQNKLIEELGHE